MTNSSGYKPYSDFTDITYITQGIQNIITITRYDYYNGPGAAVWIGKWDGDLRMEN
jgi:hypothetical protein